MKESRWEVTTGWNGTTLLFENNRFLNDRLGCSPLAAGIFSSRSLFQNALDRYTAVARSDSPQMGKIASCFGRNKDAERVVARGAVFRGTVFRGTPASAGWAASARNDVQLWCWQRILCCLGLLEFLYPGQLQSSCPAKISCWRALIRWR